MINKIEKYLAYYHGLLQIPHWIMNLVILWGYYSYKDGGKYVLQVEALYAPGSQELIMSSLIDFFVTSPLGILFLIGYHKKAKWAAPVGLISITSAFISSFVYLYVHYVYNMWELNPGNPIIMLLFSPSTVLFFVVLFKVFTKRDYLNSK